MAYSVEVRSPFLDYRVIEFARSLPVRYRYNGNVRKRILRDILSEYIPEKIFDQPKKGFSVPLDKWTKDELKNEILHYLEKNKLIQIPNLNLAKVNRIIEEHYSDKADYSMYIWRIYVLSKWIQLNK